MWPVRAPRTSAAGAPPAGRPVYAVKAERVGTYLFWWTVALFSNVGLVCFTLSIVFALNGGNKNRVAFFRAAVIMTFAGAMLFVLCLQISVGARQYELARAIAATEAQLREAKSENVRLNAELNGITGIDKICAYATEKLGMVKAESYQVECIDLSGGDAVLFAGGSEVNRGGK